MTAAKYRLIRKHGHPNAHLNGQIAEHIFVMSETIGRALSASEVVHHIDENPFNNHPDNLQLFASQAEHVTFHNIQRAKQKALEIGGNASFMKCPFCKEYDDPLNMVVSKVRFTAHHKECRNIDTKARRSTPEAKATHYAATVQWRAKQKLIKSQLEAVVERRGLE